MEYKMCYDGIVCGTSKNIGEAINHLKEKIRVVQKQKDVFTHPDPERVKNSNKSLQCSIDDSKHYLEVLEAAYSNLLGVEYESEQTYEVSKEGMKSLLDCTLYRRGIMEVEYEDIEPRNGIPYVRLYWKEHVIEDWRRKSKR